MARPSDREFELKRQNRELKDQVEKLETEIRQLRKQLDKTKEPEKKKPGKIVAKPCPDCGSEVKLTDLPHAVMELCSSGCGYRKVRNK